MTHLSNMNWMGVCNSTSNVRMQARKSEYLIRKTMIIGQMECRLSRFVCASQALNPNSWINVFSCWSLLFFCFILPHQIIFANHIFPANKYHQPLALLSPKKSISSHIQHSCHFTALITPPFKAFNVWNPEEAKEIYRLQKRVRKNQLNEIAEPAARIV